MNGWLKALIAVTCLGVVIGCIGYFIVVDRRYAQNSGKVARIKLNSTYCHQRLAQIRLGRSSANDIPVIEDCFVKGMVRQSDVVDAFKAGIKKRTEK